MSNVPRLFNHFGRARNKIMRDGIYNTVAQMYLRVESAFFDFKYGVDTHRNAPLSKLGIENDNVRHGRQYQPIAVNHLRRILDDLDFERDDVFVDFGCGKGRVLLIASEFQFAKAVGVEFSNELCVIARENASKFNPRSSRCTIEVYCTDAAAYEIEDEQNVFFFFNPFDQTIMQRVIGNIETSWHRCPRTIQLIFLNFKTESLAWQRGVFQLKKDSHLHGLALQIYRADVAHARNQF